MSGPSVLPSLVDVSVLAGPAIDAAAGEAEALARTALDANPYYAPRVLDAQRHHLADARTVQVLAVRDEHGLIGWLPFRPVGGWLGWRRVPKAFIGDYVMASTPLLARRAASAAADGLAAGMAETTRGGLWRLPRLPDRTMSARLLAEALARRGARLRVLEVAARAVLGPHGPYEAYAARHLSANRRKGLRQKRRRLVEMGDLQVHSSSDPVEVAAALEAFLALEAAGWKGRAGTALAASPATAALARAMFAADGREPRVRADWLSLDGRPVAVSLALIAGGQAHLVKTAYDESLRAVAPGLLLEEDITRAFLDGRDGLSGLDSASLPGCVLEDLWIDRARIADWLVITDPAVTEASLDRLVAAEAWRLAARERLKKLVHALTGRLRGA